MENLTKTESAVANTILDWFHKKDKLITHMKIQKLFYFSSGYYLAKYNENMIQHQFEAWPYGPVLPELYSVLKIYDDGPIIKLISHTEDNIPYIYTEGDIFDTITTALKKFCNCTAWELSNISHSDDGPWFKTIKEHGYKQKINNDLIKEYFKKNIRLFE